MLATMAHTTSIPLPASFSLIATVKSHGWHQLPPFKWDDREGKLYRLDRLAGGRLLKVIIQQDHGGGDLALEIEPADKGSLTQDEIQSLITRVRRMLQLDIDLSEFYSICRNYPPLSALPDMGAGRILRSPDLFEDAVKAICGTNIVWRQAVAAVHRLCEIRESFKEDEGIRAFPSAQQICQAGLQFLRERVKLGYRAASVAELSRRVAMGELDLAAIDEGRMDKDSIWKAILSIRGIGKTTASYLMNMLGYPEFLGIDSVTYRFVGDRYLEGRRPKNADILDIYKPFGRWKGLVYWFEMRLNRENTSQGSRCQARD